MIKEMIKVKLKAKLVYNVGTEKCHFPSQKVGRYGVMRHLSVFECIAALLESAVTFMPCMWLKKAKVKNVFLSFVSTEG